METSKTNKVQFSKWVAKFDESVEDFAAELKRLYGKHTSSWKTQESQK